MAISSLLHSKETHTHWIGKKIKIITKRHKNSYWSATAPLNPYTHLTSHPEIVHVCYGYINTVSSVQERSIDIGQ